MNGLKTIVTITPLKVEADSRTFKQAASMRRFGFLSLVIEAEASHFNNEDLPFDLRSMKGDSTKNGHSLSPPPLDRSAWFNLRLLMKRVFRMFPDSLKDVVKFALFMIHYLYRAGLRPLRFIPKASLYYLHAPYLFPAVWIISKWYGAPFIYDAHDFYTQMEDGHDRSPIEKRWIDPFYKKVENCCIRNAAAVVTVSEGIAKLQSQTFGVRPVVIRSCQDIRLEKSPSETLRDLLKISLDDFLLVSIGQAKKGMAVRECLEAMTMLPPHIHLAFLGQNHEQHLEIIRYYGMEGRIHVVQAVKPFEVISFVKSADAAIILYYPRSISYEFCLPNGFFQSVSAELPLLYPELPEIKNLAETYQLGIPIDPSIPRSISTAVKRLIESPALRSQYHENARRAKEELSWEKEEVILRDLIFSVLRNNKSRDGNKVISHRSREEMEK